MKTRHPVCLAIPACLLAACCGLGTPAAALAAGPSPGPKTLIARAYDYDM